MIVGSSHHRAQAQIGLSDLPDGVEVRTVYGTASMAPEHLLVYAESDRSREEAENLVRAAMDELIRLLT